MTLPKNRVQLSAEKLGQTVDEMAVDLARIALWIEGNKNKGQEAEDLAAAGLPVAMLDPQYVDVWMNILFHAVPDRRNSYKGWYVRKTPPWFEVFLRRYDKDSPAGRMIMDAAHQAALIEHESRRVWRKLERFAGVELEMIDTRTVAYWAAVNDVLCCRAMARQMHQEPIRKILMAVYGDSVTALREELRYRTKSDPQPRGGKRKNLAAKMDWAKARQYLADGTNAFFSPEYVQFCMFQENEPDVTVDFEHLPRMPLAKTPVMWQSDIDVMKTFLQFVGGAAPGSFEAEDVQLIVERVRPLLARAKGQKVEV